MDDKALVNNGTNNAGDDPNNDKSRVNDGFVNDEQDSNDSGFYKRRRCHSDTSVNDEFVDIESAAPSLEFLPTGQPKDLITRLRITGVPTRTRHLSHQKQTTTPRPVRGPLVSMDGMVYDPINRKFMKRPVAATDNNNSEQSYGMRQTSSPQRNNMILETANPNQSFSDARLRNPQINRLQRNAVSAIENSFLSPPDFFYQKPGSRNNLETRSVGGGSMLRSMGPSVKDGLSIISTEHASMPPTSEEEKSRGFISTLTTVGSCVYAVFIITVGLIVFLYDIFIEATIAEMYCIFLVIIGFIYLAYILIDIRLYIRNAQKHYKQKKKNEEAYDNMLKMTEVETLDGPLSFTSNAEGDITINLPPPVVPLEHPYCFTQGRHAGSFYLKLGAAGFCLGHLVHSALLLGLQVMFIQSDSDCGSIVALILDVMYPVYSFCQLFFIFKYSNVIILRNKSLGRLALMHSIASSLCFWIWTIIRETTDAIVIKNGGDYNKSTNHLEDEMEINVFNYRRTVGDEIRELYNTPSEIKKNCSELIGFDSIFMGLSPYLYPFTVEYNILIVGVFYIIWANIGNCPREESGKEEYHDKSEWVSDAQSVDAEQCKLPTAVEDNGLTSNLVIHIDCHASNKGLFGGIIIIVFTIVVLIMGFILFPNKDMKIDGVNLLRSAQIILHLVMFISVVAAYSQIKKLDINPHPISLLDDILLFICIPAFIMDLTFTFIANLKHNDFFLLSIVFIMTVQALTQTVFIADALRRCSNTKTLQRTKPGREFVTFLIVCNVATWIFMTFSIKSASDEDIRYDFYGKTLWSILGHISAPLNMFFRFHSSVCLVDIWKGAYQPGNAH